MDTSQNCHFLSAFHSTSVLHDTQCAFDLTMPNDLAVMPVKMRVVSRDKLWHSRQISTHGAINSLLELCKKGLISVNRHSILTITFNKYKYVTDKINFIQPVAEVHWMNC